jgi:hypothetical protein
MPGAGGDRSRSHIDPALDVGEQRPRHRDLGQLEDHVAAVAHDAGVPILTNFSRSVVSDQCSTSSGRAKVRIKLARL